MRTLDVLISFESPLLAIFSLASDLGVPQSILVLNIDWCHAAELREIARHVPRLSFWSKGPASAEAIRAALADGASTEGAADAARARVAEVPWTIPDRVVPERVPASMAGSAVTAVDEGPLRRELTFLMIVGMGGVQSRRGVDIALRAFAQAAEARGEAEPGIHLLVSTTLFPFPVDEALREHPSITFIYQVPSGHASDWYKYIELPSLTRSRFVNIAQWGYLSSFGESSTLFCMCRVFYEHRAIDARRRSLSNVAGAR
jgi:hypothetical protein